MNCRSMNDGGTASPNWVALSSLSLMIGSGLPSACRLLSNSWSFCPTKSSEIVLLRGSGSELSGGYG